MTDQVQSKPEEDSTKSSEEEQPLTYDDQLAKLYHDTSGQDQTFIRLTLALAAKGSHYHLETLHAYKILKNPLEAKKLVEDSIYRQKIERALERVELLEKKALKKGTSKIETEINRTKLSLSQVKTTYERIHNTNTGLSKQYGIDAKRIYGFDDKQLEEVYKRSLQAVKENPKLSLQEEIRKAAGKTDISSANLAEKDKLYTASTQNIKTFELEQYRKILDEGIQSVTFTQAARQVPSQKREIKVPVIKQTGTSRLAQATHFLNLQKQMLAQFRETSRKIIREVIEKIIKVIIKKIVLWLTKQAAKLGIKFTVHAAAQLSNAVAPVIGGILSAILVEVGFKVLEIGKYVLIGIVVTSFLLFFLDDSSVTKKFPIGVENAEMMSVRKIENNNYAWRSFERNVLGAENNRNNSWERFEEKFLTLGR